MAGPMLLCYLYAVRLAQTKSLIANRQLKLTAMTQTTTKFFCTYKNAETKGQFVSSKKYPSTEALLQAMTPYLAKHPFTLVQYQTENSFTSQP
jgi:hypothetical protein